MVRLVGVDLPRNKRVAYALIVCYIEQKRKTNKMGII